MSFIAADRPTFALVDDHIHSARLMSKVLATAAQSVRLLWLGNAGRARRSLTRSFRDGEASLPDLIIVDLKSTSSATADFVAEFRNSARKEGIALVAITADDDAATQRELYEHGADAVFMRRYELDAYRAEMAQLTNFWIRETLIWPIRA